MAGIFNSSIFNNAIFNTEEAAREWPADVIPYSCEFFLRQNSKALVSPITRRAQVLSGQGELWMGSLAILLDRATSQEFDAFLDASEGAAVTFPLWDFARPDPLGENDAPGDVTVLGTAAAGDMSFTSEGWTAGISGQLLAGDYLGVDGYLYRLSQDANSDGSGEATLQVTSPLRSALTVGMVITRTKPTVTVRLIDDGQPRRHSEAFTNVYELNFVEAW